MASRTTVALYERTATLAGVAMTLARHPQIQLAHDWQESGCVAPDVVLYDATDVALSDVLDAISHLRGVRLVGLDAAHAIAFTWTAREDTVVTITDLASVIVGRIEADPMPPR